MVAKRAATYNYNKTLLDYYHGNIGHYGYVAQGEEEVGVEIEVEGTNLPTGGVSGWAIHQDGSLRGESAEYVFNGPATRQATLQRLESFRKKLQNVGSVVNESYRTSVHVHLNAQNMAIRHIYTQMLLYIMFEDIFAQIAGSERIGNLFCLRAKDAEFFLDQLVLAVRTDDITRLNTELIRYSAVNPMALFRHGTLEFRSFRGTVDTDLIRQWVDLLLAIKDASQGKPFDNPIQIVEMFSGKGPDGLAEMIFTKDQIGQFPSGWRDMLGQGSRLIQRIAYSSEWGPTPENIKVPKKKKVAYANFGTGAGGGDDAPVPIGGWRDFDVAEQQDLRPRFRINEHPFADNMVIHDDVVEPRIQEEEL